MRKLMMTVLFIFSCTSLALAQDDYHKVEVYGGYSYGSIDRIAGSEFTSTFEGTSTIAPGGKRRGYNGFEASVTYNFSRYVGAKFDVSGHYRGAPCPSPETFDCSFTRIPSFVVVNPGAGGTFIVEPVRFNPRQTSYNFLGGVQIKDNSKDKRIKPFAHALLGMARQTLKDEGIPDNSVLTISSIGSNKVTNNGFSWALGGGLDIRVHRRFDIRVIQFDYNPVRTKEQTIRAAGEIRVASTALECTQGQFSNACLGRIDQARSLQNISIPGRTQHNFRIGFGIVFH